MAGFSLGGGGGSNTRRNTQEEEDQIARENLYIYNSSTNPTSSNRGFELWQHQEIARQHHQFYSSAPTMLAFSSDDNNPHNVAGPSSGVGVGGNRRGSSSTSGGMSCQDCGNQAKKDCSHMRCRTCCKSRGFPCPTHVKSTWVPASRRRERQQQLAASINISSHDQQQQQQQQQQQNRDILSKRPREITTRLAGTALANTGLGMEAVSFPPEVSSPAVFRCVRVSQMDQGEDQYAYQTAVNIGGHLFRGILYDQGPEQVITHGESSSTAAAVPTVAAIAPGVMTSSGNVAGSGVMVDPSSGYPTPLNAFIAGTQFFPHHDPRS